MTTQTDTDALVAELLKPWFTNSTAELQREAATHITTQAAQIAALTERVRVLGEGFALADGIACAAIQGGFYVGDGLLVKLAVARTALASKEPTNG